MSPIRDKDGLRTYEYEAINDRLMMERGRLIANSMEDARSRLRKQRKFAIQLWAEDDESPHFNYKTCSGWGQYSPPRLRLRYDLGGECAYGFRRGVSLLAALCAWGLGALAIIAGTWVFYISGAVAISIGCFWALWHITIRAGGQPKTFVVERRLGPLLVGRTELSAETIRSVAVSTERWDDNWDSRERWHGGKPWHFEYVVSLWLSDGCDFQVSHSSSWEFESELAERLAACLGVQAAKCSSLQTELAQDVARWKRRIVIAITVAIVVGLVLFAAWLRGMRT